MLGDEILYSPENVMTLASKADHSPKVQNRFSSMLPKTRMHAPFSGFLITGNFSFPSSSEGSSGRVKSINASVGGGILYAFSTSRGNHESLGNILCLERGTNDKINLYQNCVNTDSAGAEYTVPPGTNHAAGSHTTKNPTAKHFAVDAPSVDSRRPERITTPISR
jgi:hypothetical protein